MFVRQWQQHFLAEIKNKQLHEAVCMSKVAKELQAEQDMTLLQLLTGNCN